LYSHLPRLELQDTHQMNEQVSRIFRTFDRDHTNTLSFDEFLNVVVFVNHSILGRDRIKYLIRENNISKMIDVFHFNMAIKYFVDLMIIMVHLLVDNINIGNKSIKKIMVMLSKKNLLIILGFE
jgi:hypothetical protein